MTGSSQKERVATGSESNDATKMRSGKRDKLKRGNGSYGADLATESSHSRGSAEPDDVTKPISRSRDKLKRKDGASRGDFVTGSSHKGGNLIGSEVDDIPKKRSPNRDKLKRENSSSRGGFVTGPSHKDKKLIGSEADDIPTRSQSRDKLKRQKSSSTRREEATAQDTSTGSRYSADFGALGPLSSNNEEAVRKARNVLSKTEAVLADDNGVAVQIESALQGAIADAMEELTKHRESATPGHRKEREKMSRLLESLQSASSRMEERLATAEETARIKSEKMAKKQRSIVAHEAKTRKQELSKIKKFRLDIEVLLMAAESEAKELKEEKTIMSSEIDEAKASKTHQSVIDHLVSQKQKLSDEIKKNRKERGRTKAVIDRLKKLQDIIPNPFIREGVEEEETLESIIADFSGAKTTAPSSSTRMTMSGHRIQSERSVDNPIDADRQARMNPYRKGTSSPNASTRPPPGVRRTSSEPNRQHREKPPSRNPTRPGVERGISIGSHLGLRDGRKKLKNSGSLPLFSKDATEDLNASGWLYLNITGQSFRDLAELARNSGPDLLELANSASSSALQAKIDKVRQIEKNLKAMNMTVLSLGSVDPDERSVVSDEQSLGLDVGF